MNYTRIFIYAIATVRFKKAQERAPLNVTYSDSGPTKLGSDSVKKNHSIFNIYPPTFLYCTYN